MRRGGIAAVVVTLGTVAGSGQAPPTPAPGTTATAAPALDACEIADADVLMLKARVAQLEQQLVAAQLEAERIRLETKFRERLQPPPDHVFDWPTKTFKPPTPAPKPPGTPP
jgi:hypothetical protein